MRGAGALVALGLAVAELVAACALISRTKLLWMDELLSLELLADPSLAHALRALGDGVDNSFPLPVVLGWGWARLFGTSELALRLHSCAGIAIALLATWVLVRRAFGAVPALVGTLAAYLGSERVLFQVAEVRYYGTFLAIAVLAALVADEVAARERPGARLLAGLALSQGALVLAHPFGFPYGAAVLASIGATDLLRGRFRWRPIAAGLAGWLAFLAWLRPFLKQLEAVRLHSWVSEPTWADLPRAMAVGLDVTLVGVVLAATWALAFAGRRREGAARPSPRARSQLVLGLLLALGVPLATWIISRVATPMLVQRYLLPSLIGWAILLAGVTARLMPFPGADDRSGTARLQRFAVVAVVATLLLRLAWRAPVRAEELSRLPGKESWLEEPGLPVVHESPHLYLPRFHYSQPASPHHAVVDWEAALAPGSSLHATVDHHLLKAMERSYPRHQVLTTEEVLSRWRRFLVVDEPGRLWFETRVADRPGFRTEVLADAPGQRLVYVESAPRR